MNHLTLWFVMGVGGGDYCMIDSTGFNIIFGGRSCAPNVQLKQRLKKKLKEFSLVLGRGFEAVLIRF